MPNDAQHHRVIPIPAWLRLIVASLLVCQVAACIAGRGPSLAGNVDFRVFYASGSILRSGHATQLYEYPYQLKVQESVVGPRAGALPFLYPPFAAVAFVPYALVSYRSALLLFALCNGALLFAATWLLGRNLRGFRSHHPALLCMLALCLFPVAITFMQGQVSFALLTVCCVAWGCLRRRFDWSAGLLLSLMLVKPQLAIPILILFLGWKKWRVAGGFLAGLLCLTGVSWLVVGSAGLIAYARSLLSVGSLTVASAGAAKARFGMYPTDMPNVHGLLFGLSHGAPWGLVVTVLLSLAALIFGISRKPSLPTALLVAMLTSYHMQPHDLILLLLPLGVLASKQLESHRKSLNSVLPALAPKWNLSVWLIFLTFPVFPIIMMNGQTYFLALLVFHVLLKISLADDRKGRRRTLDWKPQRWIVAPEAEPELLFMQGSSRNACYDRIG